MLIQNRPFFRKYQKITTKTTLKLLNQHTSYKHSNKHKSTIHKTKKSNIQSDIVRSSYNTIGMKLKIHKIILNQLGNPQFCILNSWLGLSTQQPHIKGLDINNYVTIQKIFLHKVMTPYIISTATNQLMPLNNIKSNNILLGTQSAIFGAFKSSGLLMFSNPKLIPLSTSFLQFGFSSKLVTKHISITSRVRGIAKNPVDHPNGGRANTKGSFKTPWGSIAKHNK